MGYKIFSRPKLNDPIMFACWPGLGNVGLMAVEHIRTQSGARDLAEINPWEYFYPVSMNVNKNVIEDMVFPTSRFYYNKFKNRDVIFFIGQQQPIETNPSYAAGEIAYRLSHEVIDVALKFGCKRIYTSGAAITLTHHSLAAKVWGIGNSEHLIPHISSIPNTSMMSQNPVAPNKMLISGLNGILLGTARERNLEAICLLGELPIYLQALMLPYPKAAKAVVEAFCASEQIEVDTASLELLALSIDAKLDELMNQFNRQLPPPLRKDISEGIERLKQPKSKPDLTKEDLRKAISEIEIFFKERNDEEGQL